MRPLRETCEDNNAVRSFCDCVSDEEPAGVTAEAFCKRVADSSGNVTGDERAELKKTLKDPDDYDLDEGCCEC